MMLTSSLDKFFQIRPRGSTIAREILGGTSTFMALSYIIFVQPAVLSQCQTGPMDRSAVMFATCLCSALACLVMGLWANLPIALAPAMGHNFFFAFTVCGTVGTGVFALTWPEALAANFIAGILFLLVSVFGLRAAIMDALPDCLKYAIAAGIGLFIAFIGLEWAGIVVGKPATYIGLGSFKNPVTLLSLFGLLITGIMLVLRFRGAILLGMVLTALAGFLATRLWGQNWGFALVSEAHLQKFPDVSATAGKFWHGLGNLFSDSHSLPQVLLVIFTFLILDVFDTIGTLVGVSERAGLMHNGKLPRARRAMIADAVGTISGAVMGTSTITSYVESSAGISAGARTGLATVVTAGLFLLSIFAYPLVGILGTEVQLTSAQLGSKLIVQPEFFNTVKCYPVVAPVLIVVGCYMLPVISRIKWDDFSEALPAFLTIVVMQFSMSITDGIAWGFISFAALKLCSGRYRQCPPMVYLCSVLFVLYYIFART